MLKLRVTHTRPSVDVPYFQAVSTFADFDNLFTAYADSGKLVSRTLAYDHADNNQSLKLIIETNWRSVADHEAYLAEPGVAIVRDARIAYCSEHLIAVEYEREVIADEFDAAE